jgi:hypothetical protein
MHVKGSSHRVGARMAVLSTVVGAGLILAATAAPAVAAPTPGSASGASTVTLGGKAYNILQSGGCGTLTVTGANGVTATVVTKGVKVIFPISGVVTQDGNPDALRIDHSGSVTLENTCYTITFAALRITNFGLPDQGTSFDMTALFRSGDDTGRQVLGTLDLTSAIVSISGNKVRIAQMNWFTSGASAEELNELAVGAETGPFVEGQKIGSAKTRVVFG